MSDPYAMISHEVVPVIALDGPVPGPMVSLTLEYARVSDVLNSFTDEPPVEGHVVPNSHQVVLLVPQEALAGLITGLVESYKVLHEALSDD